MERLVRKLHMIREPKTEQMKFIYLIGLSWLLSVVNVHAQADFSGLWKGDITQNDGGYKTSYNFELFLYQDGKRVWGRSYVTADTLHAEMEIEGVIYNNEYLKFEEQRIVTYTIIPELEWCIKKGHLILKGNKISGIWEGNTSFSDCIPGRIEMKRTVIIP